MLPAVCCSIASGMLNAGDFFAPGLPEQHAVEARLTCAGVHGEPCPGLAPAADLARRAVGRDHDGARARVVGEAPVVAQCLTWSDTWRPSGPDLHRGLEVRAHRRGQRPAHRLRPELASVWPGGPVAGPALLRLGRPRHDAAQSVLPVRQQRVAAFGLQRRHRAVLARRRHVAGERRAGRRRVERRIGLGSPTTAATWPSTIALRVRIVVSLLAMRGIWVLRSVK